MYRACLLSALVIGFVGAYDNSMNVIYSETLITMEENPVGTYILCRGVDPADLRLHNLGLSTSPSIKHNLYLFVLYKSIGTMLVVGACLVLSKTKYRAAVIAIAIFQGGLFLYLNFFVDAGPLNPIANESTPICDFVKLQKKYYL
jgi:hypothetical protein